MIKNHIHDHFQSLGVRFFDETTILFVRSEARINAIIVGGIIAMIVVVAINIGRIVLQNGRKPQGRDAELRKIIKVLTNAFKVSSVTKVGL